ncbi:MAG: methyltransferase domain-containing protein [Gammaproteobacteria bacterium]|nr:methyltransferase domain-containing protein [Gammaproteobacteria bacterium]
MKTVAAHNLACPLDAAPLLKQGRQYCCPQSHSFDLARQGQLNLLPVQFKKSKDPGDSKSMIAARGAFLQRGFYQPLSLALNEFIKPHLAEQGLITVLDAGCGEGYYLRGWLHSLPLDDHEPKVAAIGLDISKWAVLAAAKKSQQATWLVGSNRHLPLQDNSVDLILSCFGFADYAQFKRVLKPKGKIILMDAGEDHLLELRRIIYEEVRQSPLASVAQAISLGFQVQQNQRVQFELESLPAEPLQQLLSMTPHLYRASKQGKQAVADLTQLSLTVDVGP